MIASGLKRSAKNMEIHYHTTNSDYRAYYEEIWRHKKKSQRTDFYHNFFWYLAILSLAAYIAFYHEEIFIAILFCVVALLYIRSSWSFVANWEKKAQAYVDLCREVEAVLRIEADHLEESFLGLTIRIPWDLVHEYSLDSDRIIIHYLKLRAIIIPIRYLSGEEREKLIQILENKKIQRKA